MSANSVAFTIRSNTIEQRLISTATVTNADDCKLIAPVCVQWDTGANRICISKRVVKELHLKHVGKVKSYSPSGPSWVRQYLVNIMLNGRYVLESIPVVETKIGGQGIDLLIGMDIISKGDFAVSNYNGETHFSFRIPSMGHADYESRQVSLHDNAPTIGDIDISLILNRKK